MICIKVTLDVMWCLNPQQFFSLSWKAALILIVGTYVQVSTAAEIIQAPGRDLFLESFPSSGELIFPKLMLVQWRRFYMLENCPDWTLKFKLTKNYCLEQEHLCSRGWGYIIVWK